MTTFRAVVLEHFRRPRNRRALEDANASSEGANPLCGDRVRVQLRVDGGVVRDAAFTADACAICIAAASILTDAVRGLSRADVRAIDLAWIHRALDGAPPAARARCATLPLETLHRALDAADPTA
ncbi:MAG TPA: iron-sulfur cluster assembly scaffold protein [Gemmatimonadaceae bacterium]|nr:iron-sulfur cluster assembly scaffold protein [Gemmatimonadaceae bacterium]